MTVHRNRGVLVTRRLAPGVIEPLAERYEVTVHDEDAPMPREKLLDDAAGKAALLATLDDAVDGELLARAGDGLRVVANHAVGTHNIDVAACRRRDVVVTNTPGVLTDATADLVWALLLASARRLGEGERWLRQGRPWVWAPNFLLGVELTGARLGVLGMGRIGQAVARRAHGFRMRVSYHNRHPLAPYQERELNAKWRSLDDLLATSQFLVVSCPLTPQTHQLLDAARLARLPESAVLVGITAGVVDEEALAAALASGRLFAAGMDNFADEPDVPASLLEQERAVLSPHLGSATLPTRQRMGRLAVENVLAVLGGAPAISPVP